ncbi:glycosyltransferase family 34 protein [Zopfia rhizophila CBS 207.26]|uniref:Glycosyltransferase family 34 protein n=1 Tax=Zopfia rhizophila CBS 207.26 TaxID=1314779 RepID=A0A6A6DIV3_9PEZI|nr:glycosyltransferase family 34 protein [Zopfia rhizophila CBS 207.26]
MAPDRFGVLASQQTRPQKRHHLPSTTRLIRYVLVVTLLLAIFAFWTRSDLSPAVTQYLPISVDSLQDSTSSKEPVDENPHEYEYASHHSENVGTTQIENVITEDSIPTPPSSSYPRIGKLTASFGEPDPTYEDAIQSHEVHNEIHGYQHFILREHMIRGLWSKHGWIMTIIGQELAKPEDQRLEWLLWHDRDTILMNPQLPLDIFIPPEPQFSNIHMLVTNDRHGLNNGVFMVRVSQWAFKLFASALSIREYQPEIPLKYTEQSGMEEVIKRPWWAKSVVLVPQRWFNGFPPSGAKNDHRSARVAPPGALLIHFASNRDGLRPERMAHWHEIAKNRTIEWDRPANETLYLKEIAEYWERLGRGESQESIVLDLGRRSWPKHIQH